MKFRLIFFLFFFLKFAVGNACTAIDFKIADPGYGHLESYEVGLLEIALEHLDGDHSLSLLPSGVNQSRALSMIVDGKAPYNIYFSGYSPSREATLRMVPIPLTRGLLGYRLLLTKRELLPEITLLKTVAQLKERVTLGVNIGWPDMDILRHAGFQVVSGSVIRLMQGDRVQAIPIGLHERNIFLSRFNTGESDVEPYMISHNQLIAYRFDSFFYVAKEDRKRAVLIKRGLENAYASGAFMKHFETFPAIRDGLTFYARHKPETFHVTSPYDKSTLSTIPARYWHQFDED